MQPQHPLGAAMWAASWGLLGWWFVQLAVGIFLLALRNLDQGNRWGALLLVAAAAASLVALAAMRQLTRLLAAAQARGRR